MLTEAVNRVNTSKWSHAVRMSSAEWLDRVSPTPYAPRIKEEMTCQT